MRSSPLIWRATIRVLPAVAHHRVGVLIRAGSLLGAVLLLAGTAMPARAARLSGSARAGVSPSVMRRRVQCVARSHANDQRATAMARAIDKSLAGRVSAVGLYETDTKTGITCQWHAGRHFYAASVIKVTILSALLVKLQAEHRSMSSRQRTLAWRMITESDNSAANALWFEVGHRAMQRFLNLAGMSQTWLSPYWGLTQITPHDEALQLSLLTALNSPLHKGNRIYIRYLMAHVIASQRWGVTAGVPRSLIVHVKNGWLPYPPPTDPWEINSIGTFTATHRVCDVAILTYRNPSMAYGVRTIQQASEVIERRLNPGVTDVTPATAPSAGWGVPDETIPAGAAPTR